MSDKKQPTDVFFIKARCHWPKLFAFGEFTDPQTGVTKPTPPSIDLMFHKVDDAETIERLKKRVNAVCRLKNPKKEDSGPFQGQGRLVEPAKMLLQDGDFLDSSDFDNHWKFPAKKQQRKGEGETYPFVADPYDPSKRITTADGPHGIYAGCIVTASIEIYFSPNWGRVGAALHAVQFFEDGERLMGGSISDEEATEGFQRKEKPTIASGEEDWSDAGGSPGGSQGVAGYDPDFDDDIPF